MKETLIEFETAKLAKEKGFELDFCAAAYLSEDLWNYKKGDLIDMCIEDENFIYQTDINKINQAVTQSLLQKWLREEHKVSIGVELNDNSRTYYWEYTITTSKDRDYNDVDCFDSAKRHYNNREFKTYEEALERGLIEALKLIK